MLPGDDVGASYKKVKCRTPARDEVVQTIDRATASCRGACAKRLFIRPAFDTNAATPLAIPPRPLRVLPLSLLALVRRSQEAWPRRAVARHNKNQRPRPRR